MDGNHLTEDDLRKHFTPIHRIEGLTGLCLLFEGQVLLNQMAVSEAKLNQLLSIVDDSFRDFDSNHDGDDVVLGFDEGKVAVVSRTGHRLVMVHQYAGNSKELRRLGRRLLLEMDETDNDPTETRPLSRSEVRISFERPSPETGRIELKPNEDRQLVPPPDPDEVSPNSALVEGRSMTLSPRPMTPPKPNGKKNGKDLAKKKPPTEELSANWGEAANVITSTHGVVPEQSDVAPPGLPLSEIPWSAYCVELRRTLLKVMGAPAFDALLKRALVQVGEPVSPQSYIEVTEKVLARVPDRVKRKQLLAELETRFQFPR